MNRMSLVAFVFTSMLAHSAAAQVSVEVSPLRVEMQAAPGSSTTQSITLTNYGKETLRIRATLSDWDLSRDGTPQFEGASPGRYSATSWVRIAPPEQLVEPGASAIVRYTATIPAGTEPAGYRTGILFEFDRASQTVTSRRELAFKSRIATLIYINAGAPVAATEIVDVQARPADAGLDVVATLKNTGRRTVRTKGTLQLLDASGAVARETTVPDVPLLPESERELTVSVSSGAQSPLPPGVYRAELKLDLGMAEILVAETQVRIPR
jgi:P pilus assembly chaperone PapD